MISIVIPAYNAQAYLRECLESVLAQTYTDWEAIIVNDGSTDSTLDIALSYSAHDPRIHVITTPNRGLSCARNAGIEEVKGRWLTFLDSDDVLLKDALKVCIGNSAGVDIVVGQYTRKSPVESDKVSEAQILSGTQALIGGLYQTGMNTSACAKLFRVELVKDFRFLEGMYYEDMFYCTQVFRLAPKIKIIPNTIYYYRDNPASFINTFSPKRLDVLRITAEIENICAHDSDLLPAARDRRLSANFNIFGLLSVHDREGKYREEKQQCWQLIKEYRTESLLNPRVRLKNKLGILISYMGRRVMGIFSKIMY